MNSPEGKNVDLNELIDSLNEDRALILEKIDQGNWPELREDLAALERELSQLLTIAADSLASE